MQPLLLLLFGKSSTFCRRCPDPEIRICQLLQRPLKMCTNSRASNGDTTQNFLTFHAVRAHVRTTCTNGPGPEPPRLRPVPLPDWQGVVPALLNCQPIGATLVATAAAARPGSTDTCAVGPSGRRGTTSMSVRH